tara:strand:+ start:134 stop:460 length:327 start_codon:yes stop_codon:yes gene_type:complete
MIKKWQHIFRIKDWDITTKLLDTETVSVEYNGHKYFVGIERNFDTKKATIYHDRELKEEDVIHELLHIVFPKPQDDETYEDYERWVTDAAYNLSRSDSYIYYVIKREI